MFTKERGHRHLCKIIFSLISIFKQCFTDDKNLLEKIEIDKKGRILQPGQELATPRSQERKELEEKNKQNVQNTAATWDLENKLVTCKSLYADLEKVAEADRLEEKEQEEARALKRAMSRQRPPVTVPHASLTRTKSQTKSAQKPEDRPAAKPKKDRKTEDHIQRNENLPTMTANVAVTSAKKKLTSNLHQMKNHRQLKNGLIDTGKYNYIVVLRQAFFNVVL